MAWEITRDLYSNPKGRPRDLVGPQLVRYDNWRSQAWDLMSHAGFLTYPHHDANGLCTYIFAQCGMKIWAILYFKDIYTEMTRQRLIDLSTEMVDENDAYQKISEPFNIFLSPGDLL